jgi:hypothetical protein
MVTSRARERRSQEDHHIGPWLEGKARGKNGNPREIRFEETRAQRKREELSCCDDDDWLKINKHGPWWRIDKGIHNADFIIESKVIYYLEQCGLRV